MVTMWLFLAFVEVEDCFGGETSTETGVSLGLHGSDGPACERSGAQIDGLIGAWKC